MYQFAERMSCVEGSAIREILKLASDPEMISFSGGSPAKETFPTEVIQDIIHRALTDQPTQALQYGITEG